MLEAMYERAEQAVKAMPGINAATVLLQAQQQLAQSKKIHKQQVTSLRAQLVALQQSSQRETNRVQTRMRELERAMETIHTRLEQERMISEKHIVSTTSPHSPLVAMDAPDSHAMHTPHSHAMHARHSHAMHAHCND